MASMTLNVVGAHALDLLREIAGETIAGATMEGYCASAYLDWCEDIQWPENSLTFDTVANIQEYNLDPTVNIIFRVYVNGNRVPATTIPLLEGDVQQIFDASWKVLPAISVPALTSGSTTTVPITAGPGFARMQYYIRGTVTAGTNVGLIGFVPKPAAIYPVIIDAAIIPATPATGDTLAFPDRFKDGLAWGGVKRFLYSDRRLQEAQGAEQLEQMEKIRAMSWRRRHGGYDQLPIIQPTNYRTHFSRRTIRGN